MTENPKMADKDSRRSQEVRADLAARLKLDADAVSRALVAFLGCIHARLPRGTAVALVSWLPEAWALLGAQAAQPARGAAAFRARVVEAGIPDEQSGIFIVEVLRVIGERVGTPIAETLRKRIPELVEIERETVIIVGRVKAAPAQPQPGERTNPVTLPSASS
jgi:hypothetical protein